MSIVETLHNLYDIDLFFPKAGKEHAFKSRVSWSIDVPGVLRRAPDEIVIFTLSNVNEHYVFGMPADLKISVTECRLSDTLEDHEWDAIKEDYYQVAPILCGLDLFNDASSSMIFNWKPTYLFKLDRALKDHHLYDLSAERRAEVKRRGPKK